MVRSGSGKLGSERWSQAYALRLRIDSSTFSNEVYSVSDRLAVFQSSGFSVIRVTKLIARTKHWLLRNENFFQINYV